jgi:ABC-type glutathione transport system ATPase component
MSVGERQRVALARALANDPPVLLADEPTGNLDSRTTDEILDLLAMLQRERELTMVIVTHSQEVADRADRQVRMRDGQIVEDPNAPITPAAHAGLNRSGPLTRHQPPRPRLRPRLRLSPASASSQPAARPRSDALEDGP